MDSQDDATSATTRRAVLAGAASAAATAGCVQRTRSLLDRGSTRQISISIKTVPADTDRAATRIARQLGDHLEAVGVDASVVLEAEDELLRSVLVSHDYEIYVARYSPGRDPDFLRPLLYSLYVEEPGWQNPFGFVDLTVDELLDEQRTSEGARRRSAVADLLRQVVELQPFTVVVEPDDIRAVRTDRFRGWRSPGLDTALGYLALEPRGDDRAADLEVATTDERVTRNFNPIAVEFRDQGVYTGLLYDSLGRFAGGDVVPWLAESWNWDAGDDETTVTVTIRDGHTWHDGTPLTAGDVAFTYQFLSDTSLGESSMEIPAPRFRGRVSLVEAVGAEDDRTLRFSFGDTIPSVASRAFTVPVLPEREWRPYAEEADIAGLELFDGVTEALVWPNPEPIGSGVLRFEESITDELLTLRRYDDHFLHRGDGNRFYGGVSFDSLTVRIAPSDTAAVELAAAGEIDATATSVDSAVVPRIGRSDALDLVVSPSRSFYHVGFNVRNEPLANPRFRGVVARLIDKLHVANRVLGGYATPTTSPLRETHWTPSDLRWTGESPIAPFLGDAGDLDVDAAREAFREIGYRFDDDGRLLTQ